MAGSDMGSVTQPMFPMRDFAISHGSHVPYLPFIAGLQSFYTEKLLLWPGFPPPGKSGVSAIFPAIKHQERGPNNRHHASFCSFAGNLVDKTCHLPYLPSGKRQKSFSFCQTEHCLPAQAYTCQNDHAVDPFSHMGIFLEIPYVMATFNI